MSETAARPPRVWPWRMLSLAAIAAALAGILTSQAWQPIDVEIVRPPHEQPPVAEVLPSAHELSEALGREFVLLAEGPPQTQLWMTTSPFFAEGRQLTQPEGWSRQYTTADGLWLGSAMAVRYASTNLALNSGLGCNEGEPAIELSVPTRVATANIVDDSVIVCADSVRGVTRIQWRAELYWTATAGGTVDDAISAFDRLLHAQYERMDDETVASSERVSMPASRTWALRVWLIALVALSVGMVAPPAIFDRATWERLRSRLTVLPASSPYRRDLEPLRRPPAARARALGFARFAVLIWALRLTEEWRLGGYATLGVLVAALVASILVERVMLGRGVRRAGMPVLTVAGVVAVVLGAAGALGVAALAIFVFQSGVSLQSVGAVPGLADWQVQRYATVIQVAAVSLLAFAWLPLSLARRLAMRLRRDNPADDDRAPVLLLRSFVDDAVRMRARRTDRRGIIDQLMLRRWERFEEVAAASLARVGPVLAVGTPGERLPPELGATRITLSNDEWQSRVRDLSEDSALIAMTLGRSEGLVWEMRRLRDNGLLHKTIFLVPPIPRRERRARLAVLAQELEIPWTLLDTRGTGRTVVAVCFPLGAREPSVLVSRGPDDLSYEAAIECAVAALERATSAEAIAAPAVPSGVMPSSTLPPEHSAPARGEVIAAGKGKRSGGLRQTIMRLPFLMLLVGNVAVGLVLIPWVNGDAIGARDVRVSIPLTGLGLTGVVGWHDRDLIVLSESTVVRVDTASESMSTVGMLGAPPEAATLTGTTLCYAAPIEFDSRAGEVGCFDLSSGTTIWQAAVPLGSRSLVVHGAELFVASPATGEVLRFRVADGSALPPTAVGGMPWSVATDGTHVGVALLDLDEVLELSTDGSVTDRFSTITAPSLLLTATPGWLVHSRAENRLVAMEEGKVTTTIWTAVRNPKIASAPGLIAIEGYEVVTLFHPAQGPVRMLLDHGRIQFLSVTSDSVAGADEFSIWIADLGKL